MVVCEGVCVQEYFLQPLYNSFQGPITDLAIETFNISMEPLLGFACKAGVHVVDLQVHAGWPE
jgi:hypothetical protein